MHEFFTATNKLYFLAEGDFNDPYSNRRLFRMDNGNAQPQVVPLDVNNYARLNGQMKPTVMQNQLFFSVRRNDTVYELWKSPDGVNASIVDTMANFPRFNT
ncbi:MAG: hypothetical protein U5L45_01770 [Saprospiraceae bacterium]|nr:hypothetical protein [Saprospiraceae bacterium]